MDPARVRSIVLVLHGGQARSTTTVRRRTQLSYLRMVPFARFLHRRDIRHLDDGNGQRVEQLVGNDGAVDRVGEDVG